MEFSEVIKNRYSCKKFSGEQIGKDKLALSKRMNFLKEVIQNLELKNVKIEIARVEDVANQYRESFDIVTARAVARLNVLLELCTPLTKEKGLFIALKGKQGPIELKESQQAIKELNVCLQEERK